jgi:hypothetical protein
MITNPVVRLHVLDPATGDYMRNLSLPGIQLDPHKQAMVGASVGWVLMSQVYA